MLSVFLTVPLSPRFPEHERFVHLCVQKGSNVDHLRVWDRSEAFSAVVPIPQRILLKLALPVRDHWNWERLYNV